MTGGAIIGLSVLTIVIISCVIALNNETKKKDKKSISIGVTLAGLLIIIGAWAIGIWYYQGTEAGKRALKTQESNFNGGIKRRVTVYDVEGDMIAEYEGKFDIEYDDDRILFDDEQGLRHIIYYPTGNVIIDELE